MAKEAILLVQADFLPVQPLFFLRQPNNRYHGTVLLRIPINRIALETEQALARILQGCRKEDRQAQHELYRLYYAYGMSISIRYAKSEDEAILILNDAFLKVFNHIRKYDHSRPFKPWFRRILINNAINYLKKQEKFKKHTSMEEASHIPAVEDILSRISYQELMRMVQSLSNAYRTVFNMYVIDGYKHEEIANMLGISVGASKSNLWKARMNLQKMIEESLNTKTV